MAIAKVGKPRKIRPLTRAQRRMVQEEIKRHIDAWKKQLDIVSDQREQAQDELSAERRAHATTYANLESSELLRTALGTALDHERKMAANTAEGHLAMIKGSQDRVSELERETREAVQAANRERDAYKEELLAAGKQAREMVGALFHHVVKAATIDDEGRGE